MANPTNLDGFSFTVFYDYTDPNGTTQTYQYAAGEGEAGKTEALRFYNEAQDNIAAGFKGLSNIVVRYISIPTWTDWEM